MKAKILLLTLAILFAIPSFAQKQQDSKSKEERRKEMMEFKLKFISDEIELKDNQKKEFYELYNQMEMERRAIFKKIKAAEKKIKDNKNASEADYEKASEEISAARAEMNQVDAKYDLKFASFLSKKQIFKMKEAERKFMETARKCKDKKESKVKK